MPAGGRVPMCLHLVWARMCALARLKYVILIGSAFSHWCFVLVLLSHIKHAPHDRNIVFAKASGSGIVAFDVSRCNHFGLSDSQGCNRSV